MDLEGRPRKQHPLSAYIEVGREQKSGMARCVLRMPRNRAQDPQDPQEEPEHSQWDDVDDYPDAHNYDDYNHYPRLSHYAGSPVMSKSNSNSSNSLHLDASEARGTADGGFHVLPEQVVQV